MREGNPTLHPPLPAGAQVAFHESIPPSQRAGLLLRASALSPQEDSCNQRAPKTLPCLERLWLCLSPLNTISLQRPLPAPRAPLPLRCPSPFLSFLFKGGKRSLVLPPLSPLRRLQGFLEGMLQLLSRLEVLPPSPVQLHGAAAGPALILGGQQRHHRVPRPEEMRQMAERDHARDLPSDPSLPHPNRPTERLRWLPTGTAAQHAQRLFFAPLTRSKVLELPNGRSGPEQRAQSKHWQREQLSRHIPPALQTSPGVTAGDSHRYRCTP